jgi:tetratricopeptide (TPR) repeat protein
MNFLKYLPLLIAPLIFLILIFFARKIMEKKVLNLFASAYFLGLLTAIPMILVLYFVYSYWLTHVQSLRRIVFYSFVLIGFLSELFKFLLLRFYYLPKKSFTKPFDGILFSVMIARLATTDPSELTQAELLYAGTLTTEWETIYNIYKSAANMFSNSWEAQNNAGYIALKMGKVEEAKDFFQKAEKLNANNGIITNNLGVIYAYQGNFKQAETYFNEANKMGIDNNYNLGIIDISKADYKGAISKFAGVSCNYNVALANMIDGNNGAATTNLDCARKNAATYYLMAIAGARTDNQEMMLSNLKKAIKANKKFKEEAKIDREFIKYFNNAEFKDIVK